MESRDTHTGANQQLYIYSELDSWKATLSLARNSGVSAVAADNVLHRSLFYSPEARESSGFFESAS